MAKAIRKAVFPVGGLGTRFLPATKANPKEMLPVVDKPLIQYAVEEAVAAGIEDLIFITGRNKRAIADHFDIAYELETELSATGKKDRLELVHDIVPPQVTCIYIRQAMPLGLGHAVLCARSVVGNEPFAVLLADDLIANDGGPGCLEQMVEAFSRTECSLLAVEKIRPEESSSYGVIACPDSEERLVEVTGIVEKPAPAQAPSDLGVVGRYVLTAEIFEHLAQTGKGAGGEIQLTDGIAQLMRHQAVMGYRFEGKRYDCGNKLGYLEATVDYALQRPEFGKEFTELLKSRVCPGG